MSSIPVAQPQSIALCLASHTNVGKTTLGRTLLARDIGEVRDAPHVTDSADAHRWLRSDHGDELIVWDTPGFGDSRRLARRMRIADNPLGWLLGQVWDRWRDRAFWSSQQALRNLREQADVVLYLVNAAESPSAQYLEPELELLQWVGKPVLVLLNQLGAPRDPAVEAEELQRWVEHLRSLPLVREVLPLDAFARCWLQEARLWSALARELPLAKADAMRRLQAVWWRQRMAVFEQSMQSLAGGVARSLAARVTIDEGGGGLGGALRQAGSAIGLTSSDERAVESAGRRMQALLADIARDDTAALITLHGLDGKATAAVLDRVAALVQVRRKLGEGRAALAGSLLSGALGGLGADLASGGLTLGAGMLAGALLGALGGVGAVRGINVVRGTEQGSVALRQDALEPLLQQALLRYLSVAHFGRGRGNWVEGEAPPHWAAVVDAALAAEEATIKRLHGGGADAAALLPLLSRSARRVLESLYPGCWDGAGAAAR